MGISSINQLESLDLDNPIIKMKAVSGDKIINDFQRSYSYLDWVSWGISLINLKKKERRKMTKKKHGHMDIGHPPQNPHGTNSRTTELCWIYIIVRSSLGHGWGTIGLPDLVGFNIVVCPLEAASSLQISTETASSNPAPAADQSLGWDVQYKDNARWSVHSAQSDSPDALYIQGW